MEKKEKKETICIIGLGYVGLTLGVVFAEEGFPVIGVDTNPELIARLKEHKPHFYEPRLEETLKKCQQELSYATTIPKSGADIYVISVGTNVTEYGKPDYSAVESATDAIAAVLKKGDMVILRSTVTVGTTRVRVKERLEALTGLLVGEDFDLVFAPERTIEGKALEELRKIPQVVGGCTKAGTTRAAKLFGNITEDIVEVDSPEEAEFVKLASNAHRDLSFAFANNLAQITSHHNVNVHNVIRAANHGYERNRIALPSPGVGGYCLTKDPILLAESGGEGSGVDRLLKEGRQVNARMPGHVADILTRFRNYSKIAQPQIVIFGLAFKGDPPTSDCRFSPSMEFVSELRELGFDNISGYDPLVEDNIFEAWDVVRHRTLNEALSYGTVLVFMHRNEEYRRLSSESLIQNGTKLIVDTWSIFDFDHQTHNVDYASLSHRTF